MTILRVGGNIPNAGTYCPGCGEQLRGERIYADEYGAEVVCPRCGDSYRPDELEVDRSPPLEVLHARIEALSARIKRCTCKGET